MIKLSEIINTSDEAIALAKALVELDPENFEVSGDVINGLAEALGESPEAWRGCAIGMAQIMDLGRLVVMSGMIKQEDKDRALVKLVAEMIPAMMIMFAMRPEVKAAIAMEERLAS